MLQTRELAPRGTNWDTGGCVSAISARSRGDAKGASPHFSRNVLNAEGFGYSDRPGKAASRGIQTLFKLRTVLSNALKVTRSGGTVTIRAARYHDYIRFSVADTGPGIPTEE